MAVYWDRRALLKVMGTGAAVNVASGLFELGAAPAAAAQLPAARGGMGMSRVAFARASLANGIIPHAGETSAELYHRHPHDPKEEIVQPDDIRLQTRLVMRNHKEILDWAGLSWKNVVKITRYQKRMEETRQIDEVLASYFKESWPAMTIYEIAALSSPQARLEIDMWVFPNETRVIVG
jgi:enamine deaminase RidA (YjgF/YER057c/UK114 family)